MKYAVLSDIHGNLDALEKVLLDLQALKADRVLCLGDMIGYGPQPEEVIAEIRRRNIQAILGNHELAVTDRTCLDWFNPPARRSLVQTLGMLRLDSLSFIRNLKPFLCIEGCHFVHGFPPDSPLTYLFQVSEKALARTFLENDFRICFLGHTHDLEVVSWRDNRISRSPLREGKTVLRASNQYILNIGSVGQPRDGSAEAKYVLWDSEENLVELRCVPYDYAAAAEKILAAGLPRIHAERLFPR